EEYCKAFYMLFLAILKQGYLCNGKVENRLHIGLEDIFHHVSPEEPGGDAIDIDVIAGKLHCKVLGEHFHGGLGWIICYSGMSLLNGSAGSEYGRDVDDLAAALIL